MPTIRTIPGAKRTGGSASERIQMSIRNLTRDQAMQIYRRDYWDSLGCDQFPPAIVIALFDSAVN